jgi:hypothetical protein
MASALTGSYRLARLGAGAGKGWGAGAIKKAPLERG